jgi:hypothetical protein
LNVEEAENAKEAKNSPSLDEDQLGRLEEDIRVLGRLLKNEESEVDFITKYLKLLKEVFKFRIFYQCTVNFVFFLKQLQINGRTYELLQVLLLQ